MLQIDSNLLKEVFNYLSPSLKTGAKSAYQKSILVTGNKEENKVTFQASSEVESTIVLVQGDYEIENDFTVCVDKFIQDIVSKLSGKVKFLIDKENLIVKVNGNKYSFGTLEADKFPERLDTSEISTHMVEDKQAFFETFALASFCSEQTPTTKVYKSFNLENGMTYTIKEEHYMAVLLKRDYGTSNPPVQELSNVLTALKALDDEDEMFYQFNDEICLVYVSAKDFDIHYVFKPIEGRIPSGFFDAVNRFETKEGVLTFTIKRENLTEIIETANTFAIKAKQEGYPTYVTMTCEKSIVNFLMVIPTVSEFNILAHVEDDLIAKVQEFSIDFDPVNFKEFLSIGGDVTMKFFDDEETFVCTTSDYDDLIYFQTTVRKRKGV